jgi:hypothetical protein
MSSHRLRSTARAAAAASAAFRLESLLGDLLREHVLPFLREDEVACLAQASKGVAALVDVPSNQPGQEHDFHVIRRGARLWRCNPVSVPYSEWRATRLPQDANLFQKWMEKEVQCRGLLFFSGRRGREATQALCNHVFLPAFAVRMLNDSVARWVRNWRIGQRRSRARWTYEPYRRSNALRKLAMQDDVRTFEMRGWATHEAVLDVYRLVARRW